MKKTLGIICTIASLLLLGYHVFQLWISSGSGFHQDEYQHIHIAWDILNGKLPYKDFFETHGPLSGILFSLFLKLAPEPTASVSSIFFLRKLCLLMVYTNLILMFFCLRNLSKDLSLLLLTSVLFVGGLTMQVTSFRIRPDIFVQTFLILALIFWFKRKRFFSGVCLGLGLGFNPKFLPINIAFLVADFLSEKLFFKNQKESTVPVKGHKAPQCISMLVGELSVWLIICAGLLYKDILLPALETNFLTNIRISLDRQRDLYWRFKLFRSVVELDLTLLVCSVVALLVFLFLLHKRKITFDSKSLLFVLLTVTSLGFLTSPVVHHSALIIIPIFVVLTIDVTSKIFKNSSVQQLTLLTIGLIISYVSFQKLHNYNGNLNPNFKSLEKILKETNRTDPIFYYWPTRCPAYVFNSDHSKFWTFEFRTEKMKQGEHENRLLNPQIKWVALGNELYSYLYPDEKDYLEANFEKFDCIWKRK